MVSRVEKHHSQILKGVLDMCVLASIVEEPDYGYALVQKLNEKGLTAARPARSITQPKTARTCSRPGWPTGMPCGRASRRYSTAISAWGNPAEGEGERR